MKNWSACLLLCIGICAPIKISTGVSAWRATSSPVSCREPNYCAYSGTDIKPYSGIENVPPTLNQAFTDPTFNRKIWRITDTNTSSSAPGDSIGIYFHPFQYAGQWNKNDTALMLGGAHGDTSFMKVNLSNPSAPSAQPWGCKYSRGIGCNNPGNHGKIIGSGTFAVPVWSNTQNYVAYGINQNIDSSLWKCDFTATYADSSLAPTCSRVYSPFDKGQCLDGQRLPTNGGNYVAISPDDQYVWGFNAGPTAGNIAIVIHKVGAGCKVLNIGTTPWKITGDGSWGGTTGDVSFTDDVGGAVGNAGASCQVHGATYDAVTNQVLLDIGNVQDGGCNVLPPDQSPAVVVNLATKTAAHITHPAGNGLGGHGFGLVNVGGVVGDLFESNPLCCNFGVAWGPLAVSARVPRYTHLLDWAITNHFYFHGGDWHGSNTDYINGHTTLPVVGVAGIINAGAPIVPVDTYTVDGPYDGEITATVIKDLTGNPGSAITYRFVHHYSDAGNYGRPPDGPPYGVAVFPAISRDRCWVAFASDWMGHLGDLTAKNPRQRCTVAGNCRYDVFLTYLCGPDGT